MRISATILALIAALAIGCAAPLSTSFLSGSRKQDDVVHVGDQDLGHDSPRAAAVRKAMAEQPVSHEQALADILDELQEIRAIDPEAERQLMADLKAAKPEHYPMIVDAFRAALAYRQQLAAREHPESVDDTLIATDNSFAELMSHETPLPERDSAERAAAVQASLAAARAARKERLPQEEHEIDRSDASRLEQDRYALTPASIETPIGAVDEIAGRDQVVDSPAPTTPPRSPADLPSALSTPVTAYQPGRPIQPVSEEPSLRPVDYRTQLDWAINALASTVSSQPTSVTELHDHMRLRTLQLLAGRQEEAFQPIPGASADQQDYWSKQLFAISAYLDSGSKLDDKQRAAAALSALDEARSKLSELATLQIRNATFVTSVEGFGAYTPSKTTKFQAGEKVSLYAEVENFRSNTAEDGYHTSLATSYQVLDKTGRRVDGKQFPEVVDKCRNRRRDFHMQYELPLPTRIYPGPYDLELTITDHNSGKIGQTTIPFEIVGDR